MTTTKSAKWPSEAAMCAEFQRHATAEGWLCYPETAGHDLVLVAGDRVAGFDAGEQIAVEAKLRGSLEVLEQAIPKDRGYYPGRRGADYYAVLIPDAAAGFSAVARALGIIPIGFPPSANRCGLYLHPWDREAMRSTCDLPLDLPLRVEMAGGHPSPRSVTPWKVGAVRLCQLTGEITPADFAAHKVNPRLFIDRGWMEVVRRDGRSPVWRILDHPRRPDRLYPEIVAALLRDAADSVGAR